MVVLHSRAGIVAMAPSPSRMALGGTQFIASATNGQRELAPPVRCTTAGRTPLATACAAHCVLGICRYGCTLVAMAPSPSRMALGGTQFIASATNGQRELAPPVRRTTAGRRRYGAQVGIFGRNKFAPPARCTRRVSPLPECVFASTWTCGGDLLYYMT